MTEFRPQDLLRVLLDHGVHFVLIGGFAATLYGSAVPTFDVDITPEITEGNLERLSAALKALDARIRVEGIPEGLPFAHDAATLSGMSTLNLVTAYGDLDIAFRPAGVGDFRHWDERAKDVTVIGLTVRVAALEDVVRSKEAAGRDKDRIQLPLLRALLDRLRGGA